MIHLAISMVRRQGSTVECCACPRRDDSRGALFSPLPASARWLPLPPALPAPTGNSSTSRRKRRSRPPSPTWRRDTTIVIAPGTYHLTKTLIIRGPLADVTVRGATNSRDDVILQGAGMANPNHNGAEFGFWVGEDVQRLRIANLTVRDFYTHPIIMNAGPQSPHLYNIHLINGGEQLLKTNPFPDGSGINNGIIEHSVFDTRRRAATGTRTRSRCWAGRTGSSATT